LELSLSPLTLQDCEDPNPLIRALAVRTMGCIRVDKITEYLCEPLRKCLKDEDPYVRKTAAVCVAKLHDINAQLVEDQGFLDTLKDLISDSNPMVIILCFLYLVQQMPSLTSASLYPCSHVALHFWMLFGACQTTFVGSCPWGCFSCPVTVSWLLLDVRFR